MVAIAHLSTPSAPRCPWLLKMLWFLGLWCASNQAGGTMAADAVTVGIEGHYRVGRWTGVRLEGVSRAIASLETRDGDGVQVQYRQSQPIAGNGWGYVIPGSQAAPLILRADEEVILSTRFPTVGSPSRGPAMIPLKMPWIVAVGDPLGVDQIGANKLLGRDPMIAVSKPRHPGAFPDSSLGYDGVDMIILGGPSAPLLARLGDRQRQAMADWITGGGRVFLTLGQSSAELMKAAPWLRTLLPIKELVTTKIDPSALETYTSSQTPLRTFTGARLPKDQGRVLVMGRTPRRVSTPIAANYNIGLGRITVVTADLDNEMFAAWPERLDLITRLTGSILVLDQKKPEQRTRATAYNDLAGQLRITLDHFAIRRQFGFSIVSLILMALVAAIGPLDYLLINRLLGRPLLGWVSFPLAAIGLSILLVLGARPATQGGSVEGTSRTTAIDTRQCNRIEIFDLDSVDKVGRGFTASYLYTHDASRFDVEIQPQASLTGISEGIDQRLTVPFGYAGESFGGIQIAVEDARLPTYQVTFSGGHNGGSLPQADPTATVASLGGLPLASRSSKGIATSFRFTPKLAIEASIEHRPGSELLQGELVNPLPLNLHDGMLVYRNWAYLLPTRFPPGGRIPSVDKLRQKNFRWRLSRQKALESATETEDWDPAEKHSPQRIAEMLMFHAAVGGTRYTGLRNDPLSLLDLTHVLAEDRCILIARVTAPMTRLCIRDGEATQEIPGNTLTMIRVVLPVTTPQRR